MITVRQLVDWIVTNKKGKVFGNLTKDEIMSEIYHAIGQGVFVYHADGDDIQGVACGEVNQKERIVFIHDVLTTKPFIIRKFMERFLLVFPGYKIEGQRNGRKRFFNNPTKVLERLNNYG